MASAPGPTLQYEVVDVFTDVAFAGNPLAVVLDTDGMNRGAAGAGGRVPPVRDGVPAADLHPGADYRLRIFTPSTELPFAGHPRWGRPG